MNVYKDLIKVFDGGKGSGNWGHAGRPGKIGGSGEGGSIKYVDMDVIKNPKEHSMGKYLTKDKHINPGRIKLQRGWVNSIFDGVKKSDKPIAYFSGGGSATGKSSSIKLFDENFPINSDNIKEDRAVVIDADRFKKMIPEYKAMNKMENPKAAGYVHEESSSLVKKAYARALAKNDVNILMDGTLGGNIEKCISNINEAKSRGMETKANIVTVPVQEALKRNYLRYLNEGRLPDVNIVIKNHRGVSKNFEELAKNFDSCNLLDNYVPIGEKPKLLAKAKDGKIEIVDKKGYKDFINKMNSDAEKELKDFKNKISQYENEWKKANPDKTLRPRPAEYI